MTLADQLKRVIDESGLSLYAVSEGSGVDYSAVYRFYHGQRDIQLSTADLLTDFFQMKLTRPKRPKGGE